MASLLREMAGGLPGLEDQTTPPITKSFPTKASALKWSQRVESDPEKFLTEQLPEAHQLMTLGDLLRKYVREVTPRRRGRDKEKYRLRVLRGPTSQVCH